MRLTCAGEAEAERGITVDRELYHLLKRTAGPRGMSRFIADALRERLLSSRESLHKEYLAASKDRQRTAAIKDWDALDSDWD